MSIASGGILETSAFGNNAVTITGGNLTAGNGTDLIVNQFNAQANPALTIASSITGAIGLTKDGPGNLILSANNTFTGQTHLTGGVTNINADLNFGSSTINLTSTAGSTAVTLTSAAPQGFGVGSTLLGQTVTAIAGTAVTLSGGASNTEASASVAYLNPLTLTNTTLQFNAASITMQETTVATAFRNIALVGGTTFDTQTNTVTIGGVISGTGSLTKISGGTLTLNNAETYTGGTFVNGGTLTIGTAGNIAVTSSGPLVVSNGRDAHR